MSNFKKDLEVLLKAIHAISPSRNIVSQILFHLPQKAEIMCYSYPELLNRKFKELLEKMGVDFNQEVKMKRESFSYKLVGFIHDSFDWLSDEHNVTNIALIINKATKDLPNPRKEWLKIVIEKIAELTGKDFIKVLKVLVQNKTINWNDLQEKLRLDTATMERIKHVLLQNDELIREEKYFHVTTSKYLHHGLMHLDLVIKTVDYYTYQYFPTTYYRVKDLNVLKEILEEMP